MLCWMRMTLYWQIDPWGIAALATPIGHTDTDELPVQLNAEGYPIIPELWLKESPSGKVKLDPTLRATLDKLKEKNISVSIASINPKASVMQYLEAFGLEDRFVQVE